MHSPNDKYLRVTKPAPAPSQVHQAHQDHQDHQDHQGHQGQGSQANGGAAEIRVCGMKNVTTDKMASNPCELLSEKSKHFQKLLPQTHLGRDFSEL